MFRLPTKFLRNSDFVWQYHRARIEVTFSHHNAADAIKEQSQNQILLHLTKPLPLHPPRFLVAVGLKRPDPQLIQH
ncbi:MAG: hypothetical protein Ct9H300mP21_10890 [Pseudomonadota bacterium]|nr:MAG: hypothetical protein Ct9H300mP21_10890 [Pseudomonadota bacterium]